MSYKVIFKDNTSFEGGDYKNSKWNEIPEKEIKKLEYKLVEKTLILTGFEAYNHLIERVQFVNKPGGLITKLILMGKHKEEVFQIIFDFQKKKTYKKTTKFGREYMDRATSGWKVGLSGKPKMEIG